MNVAERDFSNFELGDDVYKLANGLVPEIAGRLGFMLGEKPDSGHMHDLVGVLGKNKVLRDNARVQAINLEVAAELLERSGVQKPLDRSLWTPDRKIDPSGLTIVTGAVPNWQDRATKLVAEEIHEGTISEEVRIVTGSRVMDRPSEKDHPNIRRFRSEAKKASKSKRPKAGNYPTETQYAKRFALPAIRAEGSSILTSYDVEDGEAIASNYARDYKELFRVGHPIVFARVANAGVQLATQFRAAIREHANPEFDADPENPEVFILTDGFPIARNDDQVQDSANYQSPYTGLRQAVLTAKVLHEAVQA